jgi:hypothetical protein
MRVWVNTTNGWVQHGGVRSTPGRAAAVARLLATRLGWETAAGVTAPPPLPASGGAPTAAVAAVSPASFDATAPRRAPDAPPPGMARDPAGESEPYLQELACFALEAQLRDFIVANISRVPVGGTRLRLYRDSAGRSGREYSTGVGFIDILAVDDSGNFYVFELELDRGPDRTLGQLTRYMGWVTANLAAGSEVRGVVVARSIDDRLRFAAAVMPNVVLLEYEMDFSVREVRPVTPHESRSSRVGRTP